MITQTFSELDKLCKSLTQEHEEHLQRVVNKLDCTLNDKFAEMKENTQNIKLEKKAEQEITQLTETVNKLQNERSKLMNRITSLECQKSISDGKYNSERFEHENTKVKYKLAMKMHNEKKNSLSHVQK